MDPSYGPDAQNCSQLDFSMGWNTECTIEQAIHRGHEMRRGKPQPLPPREMDVVNIDLGRSPGCGRRKIARRSRMRQRRSISPCCCSLSRRGSPIARRRAKPEKYKTHCGMRIAELAVPTKRHCLDTWRSNCHTLPAYMVERLRNLVKDQTPVVAIADALHCFKRVCKRQKKSDKYKENDKPLDKREKIQCVLSLLTSCDIAVLCALFGHRLAKKLAIPKNIVLSPDLQNIACVIWCDIACMMRCPNTKGIYTRNYKMFEEDIVKKITIWIAQILEDTYEKMLEEEIKDYEDEVGPALDAADEIIKNAIDTIPDEPVDEKPSDDEEKGEQSSSSSSSTSCNSFIEITIDKIDKDGNIIIETKPEDGKEVTDKEPSEENEPQPEAGDEGTTPEEEDDGVTEEPDEVTVPEEPDNGIIPEQPDEEKPNDIDKTSSEHSQDKDDSDEPPKENTDIDVEKDDDDTEKNKDDEVKDDDIPTKEGDPEETPPVDDANLPPKEDEEVVPEVKDDNFSDSKDDPDVKESPSKEGTDLPPKESEEDILKPVTDDGNDTVPPSDSPEIDPNTEPTDIPKTDEILPPIDNVEELQPKEIADNENPDNKESDVKEDEFLESEDGQQPSQPPDIPADDTPEVFDDATENNKDDDKTVKFDKDVNIEATTGKKYESDLDWKVSIERINFSEPNDNLLSNADESWPGELLTPVLRPSQSVSKSITSLGKIKEDEEAPREDTKVPTSINTKAPDDDPNIPKETAVTEKKPAEKRTSKEKADISKPRTSKDSTASRDSKGKIKPREERKSSESKKPKPPPKRPSSVTSSKRSSQDSKTEPSRKPRPIPKKTNEKLVVDPSKKHKDTDSNITAASVSKAEDKNTIVVKKKADYRVNFQTAPIWINRNFDEPSCNCFQIASTAQVKPSVNENLVRRWCRDLERGYQNLKMWNDWVEHTSRTVNVLQREIDQIAGKSYCDERCSNKGLMKLKRNIDRDAQMWKKLNLHTQERLRCYKKLYQKRSETSCTTNYLICCSKTNV